VKFLLDAQLPPRLTRALTRGGHVALHVYECGLLTAPDRNIGKYAVKQKAVVITKDADFAAMAAGPVWLRLGNVNNDVLIAAVMAALPEIVAAVKAGEGLVEARQGGSHCNPSGIS
jgi:predicted nuclease of predicted toxin-antitoxin system